MPLIKRKIIGPFILYERVPKPKGMTKYIVSDDVEVHDFGKYSTAIRWCKAQLPKAVPSIVVNADTKQAVSNVPVDYTIIDGPHRYSNKAAVNPNDPEFNNEATQLHNSE